MPFDLFGSIKNNKNSLSIALQKGLYHQGKPSNTSINPLSHHQLVIPLLPGFQHTDKVLNSKKERNKNPTTTKTTCFGHRALPTLAAGWEGREGGLVLHPGSHHAVLAPSPRRPGACGRGCGWREKEEGEVSGAAGSDIAKTVSEWDREGLV